MFRSLLEEHAYGLSDRHGMSDLIPFIQSEEQQQIKAELQGKKVWYIFDGTTRLFCHQTAISSLLTLTNPLTGEEIARELINVLSVEYSISSETVLASMRDRASSNGVAMRTLQVDSLQAFPFFEESVIAALKSELPPCQGSRY